MSQSSITSEDSHDRAGVNKPLSPTPAARFICFLRDRPYTIVTIVTLTTMGIFAVAKKGSAWNQVYVGASQSLLHGRNLYRDVPNYTYPPFSAWAGIPFVILPARIARGLWYVICAAATVYLIRKAWQLAAGPMLETDGRRAAARPREQAAFLIGIAFALQFALNALTHLQTDLLIGALLMAGCAALLAGQFYRSAAWLGLAAAFKATPLLFAPYLLWRRRWAAAGLLVCIAVGANLLPDTVHSPPGGGLWLTQWTRLYLAPMGKANYLPGDWQNQLNNNQSIAGAVRRWMGTSWDSSHSRPDAPAPASIRRAFYVGCALVMLPVLWLAWRRRRLAGEAFDPSNARPDAADRFPSATAIECGIALLLMLLLSPNSSRAHFCIAFLPAFCIARLTLLRSGAALRVLLALAVLLSTLSIHIRLPWSYDAEQLLLWLGVITLATLFLLLACILALTGKNAA